MLNEVKLIGNLGQDPEIRTTQAGQRFARLRVATSEYWRNKTTGEKAERTEWHSIQIWSDHYTQIAEQFAHSGDTVFISGTLRTRKYQAQDGSDRYATEIEIGRYDGKFKIVKQKDPSRRARAATPAEPTAAEYRAAKSGGRQSAPMDLDDDIPF